MSARGGEDRRRSWILLAIVLALAAVFVLADRSVRAAPHLGFVPEGVEWFVATDDFPGVWRGITSTDAYARLTSEVRSPLDVIQLEIRKESGMRLTPVRWSLWIGDSFTAAARSGETVFVVHPGILSRAAEPVVRTLNGFTESGGVVNAGNGYYAWRDGFCIASESRELVEACLSADAKVVQKTAGPRTIRWRGAIGEESIQVALATTDRLPLEIVVEGTEVPSDRANDFPSGPWPTEVARVEGLPMTSIKALVESAAEYWSERTQAQADELLDVLPDDAPATSFVLTGLETIEGRLVIEPQIFMTAAPVDTPPTPDDRIPYYWDDVSGWILPWWGESFTLCFAHEDSRVYYASSQSVMADHLELARAHETGPAGRVYVNWERVADAAAHVILQAADHELLPEMDRRDASEKLVPYARAVAALGETVLTGDVDAGRLILRGHLASPLVAEAE